jgi:tetratricopeptide (TPR) repeat protein
VNRVVRSRRRRRRQKRLCSISSGRLFAGPFLQTKPEVRNYATMLELMMQFIKNCNRGNHCSDSSLGVVPPEAQQMTAPPRRFPLHLLPSMFRKASSTRNNIALVEVLFGNVSTDVVLGLDAAHLDGILMKIICEFSADRRKSLIKTAKSVSYNIGAVKKPVGTRIGGANLEEIADMMETLLSNTNLPASVVAYVHTYLGMIRQQQKRYDDAIGAFVKALWIRRSCNQPLELIAVASYRLGVAHSLNDDIEDAKVALKQAIQYYSKVPISMDHEFVVAAQKCLWELKHGERSLSYRRIQDKLDLLDKDEATIRTTLTDGGWNSFSRIGSS